MKSALKNEFYQKTSRTTGKNYVDGKFLLTHIKKCMVQQGTVPPNAMLVIIVYIIVAGTCTPSKFQIEDGRENFYIFHNN